MDFWAELYEEMKFEHDQKMYPPKVVIAIKEDSSSVQNIRVTFSHLKKNDLDAMDVTLCRGIYMYMHVAIVCSGRLSLY